LAFISGSDIQQLVYLCIILANGKKSGGPKHVIRLISIYQYNLDLVYLAVAGSHRLIKMENLATLQSPLYINPGPIRAIYVLSVRRIALMKFFLLHRSEIKGVR
jgi:hypothetical protein